MGGIGDGEDIPDGTPGSLLSYGSVAGGAIYYGEGTGSLIQNVQKSMFKNNRAYLSTPGDIELTYRTIEQEIYDFTRGGAIFADPNVVLLIENCDFIENLGGALYISAGDLTALTVDNCLFENNATYDPASKKALQS